MNCKPCFGTLCWHELNIFQGKSEGFDSCDRPNNLLICFEASLFQPVWHWIGWMTSKNNRALLLYYIKLCASSQSHRWIPTGVTVRKPSIRVKIGDILSRVTLKFDGWPWETIGNLCYAASRFKHHFVPLVNSHWSYSPETPNLGQNRRFF